MYAHEVIRNVECLSCIVIPVVIAHENFTLHARSAAAPKNRSHSLLRLSWSS